MSKKIVIIIIIYCSYYYYSVCGTFSKLSCQFGVSETALHMLSYRPQLQGMDGREITCLPSSIACHPQVQAYILSGSNTLMEGARKDSSYLLGKEFGEHPVACHIKASHSSNFLSKGEKSLLSENRQASTKRTVWHTTWHCLVESTEPHG